MPATSTSARPTVTQSGVVLGGKGAEVVEEGRGELREKGEGASG